MTRDARLDRTAARLRNLLQSLALLELRVGRSGWRLADMVTAVGGDPDEHLVDVELAAREALLELRAALDSPVASRMPARRPRKARSEAVAA